MELTEITFWHWLILAIVLLGFELMTGTVVLLWITAACVGVAGIVYFQPSLIWEYQFAWASILIVLSIILWHFSGRFFPSTQSIDNPSLNRRSEQYVGRVFTLSDPIVNGVGKIKVDDSSWRVMGEDADVNSQVKVISANGMILNVELLNVKD